MEHSYFSGTSGILLPYKNRSFYPEHLEGKSRLAVYSLLFNSLEVNSSFYKIPREETVRRWSEETADSFRFTFKLWKGITHQKELGFDPQDVVRFLSVIDAVSQKKGCLLIQLPPSCKFTSIGKLTELLDCISQDKRSEARQVCVEFRNDSWYREETLILLKSYGMHLVIHDKDTLGMRLQYTDTKIIYMRFHGPDGDYRGSYSDSVLKEYSTYINGWIAEEKEVYTYFNNTIGAAIENLNTLAKYITVGKAFSI
ncbi:DUF72 domain-containing protein [Sphingobacterium sp. 2149]|uniref:DUF72 domain-containing protein n=1 Tax=Sphingobacterium sp. 2149 TaxID=2817763 RepID=UPI0028653ECB|nr:DUF72 domain-containing protein [Sphingobacterium sp. 2149]MDR6737039.1 uncharacterized protein YecE (DUF72 family) [Sphingobacterium sp. 2149]